MATISFVYYFSKTKSLSMRWLLIFIIIYLVIFDRGAIIEYRLYSKIQVSDLVLAIFGYYTILQYPRYYRENGKVPLQKHVSLYFIIGMSSIILTYIEMGYQEGFLSLLRVKLMFITSFTFFATLPRSDRSIIKIIEIIYPVIALLSLYSILYPFIDAQAGGTVRDASIGGWNRTGAYLLVPASCFLPIIFSYNQIHKRQSFVKKAFPYVIAFGIILSISKSTIFTAAIAILIYWALSDNRNLHYMKVKRKLLIYVIAAGLLAVSISSVYKSGDNYFTIFAERVERGVGEMGFLDEDAIGWRGFELLQVPILLNSNPFFGRSYDVTLYNEVKYLNETNRGYRQHADSVVHTGFVIMLWQGGLIGLSLFIMILIHMYNLLRVSFRKNKPGSIFVSVASFTLAWIIVQLLLNDFSRNYGSIMLGFMFGLNSMLLNINQQKSE
jgi:hypothetical protein